MTIEYSQEWKDRLDERFRYRNFSEDVDIIKETICGENLSLYVVINKNGVTFQNVPGVSYVGTGRMGYIRGDRTRPVMLGMADYKTRNDIRAGISVVTNTSPDGNRISSRTTIVIDYQWDIQLYAEREAENDTETKSTYLAVL